MSRARCTARPFALAQALRSVVARQTLAAILVPLIAMSSLIGPLFLAHAHGEHAPHFHPIGLASLTLAAPHHDAAHGHEHPCSDPSGDDRTDRESTPADDSENCAVVSLLQPIRASSTTIDLSRSVLAATALLVMILPPPQSELTPQFGPVTEGPPTPWAACATERLVRTSRALLI